MDECLFRAFITQAFMRSANKSGGIGCFMANIAAFVVPSKLGKHN